MTDFRDVSWSNNRHLPPQMQKADIGGCGGLTIGPRKTTDIYSLN
jgi:hypothetical protein